MNFCSFTSLGRHLVESCSEVSMLLFPILNQSDLNDKLIIVTPNINDKKEKFEYFPWKEIYNAWKEIQKSNPGKEMKAWREILKHGEEIIPGLGVYRLKKSETNTYFYLLAEEDFSKAFSRLNDLFYTLNAWQHLKRKRGFYHSSGVVCEDFAYIFIGPSGSGKSTICNMSKENGFPIIHDDHVVVYQNEKGKYNVTDRTLSISGVKLRALFFLKKDKTNHLVRFSSLDTASRLLKSSFESQANVVLHGELIKNVFTVSADIARCIPGYELHFRKSPDFWDLIHDEFGNPQSV